MKYYTDMAFERFNFHFKADSIEKLGGQIQKIVVNVDTVEKSRYYEKPLGNYICINTTDFFSFNHFKRLAICLSEELKRMFNKFSNNISLLVVGLGNNDVVCDMFGGLVCDKLIIKSEARENENLMFSYSPGVKGKTGIDSHEIIKNIIKQTGVNMVLIVDSFYALHTSRLAKSFQLSNGGIKINGVDFSSNSFNVPVLVLGCPFAIKMETIINKVVEEFWSNKKGVKISLECLRGGENVVTLLDIKQKIENVAKLFSASINMAVHDLTFEDVIFL